eukprot:164427-Rhodomonas_salina.1
MGARQPILCVIAESLDATCLEFFLQLGARTDALSRRGAQLSELFERMLETEKRLAALEDK